MKEINFLIRYRKPILLLFASLAVLYVVFPCVYVRFILDGENIKKCPKPDTREDRSFEIPCSQGRSVIIRRYGSPDSSRRVVFFAGQHGGVAYYEKTLFRDMVQAGLTVYALSYPGQDGAQGTSRMSMLREDVATALETLDTVTSGKLKGAVFVGRSLGATVAVFEAERFHPKALLLEGVSPSLPSAIRAHLKKHWFTYLWSYLPCEHFVSDQFSIVSPLEKLRGTPVWIFQGSHDESTPLNDLYEALRSISLINIEVVPSGTHHDTFKAAKDKYLFVLQQLAH